VCVYASFFLTRSMKQDQRSSCTSRICCALLEGSTCEILCYPRANHLFRKRPNPSAHADGMATDRIPLLLAPGGTTPPRLFFFFCSHSLLVKTVIAVKVSPPLHLYEREKAYWIMIFLKKKVGALWISRANPSTSGQRASLFNRNVQQQQQHGLLAVEKDLTHTTRKCVWKKPTWGWWFKLLRADQINQTSGGITAFIIHASLQHARFWCVCSQQS
jgi:hypothetical protein